MLASSTTCWVLTDGKAGDEVQCLGVAEALGLTPDIRRVRPRRPFVWAMPWGPIDPADAPARPGSPIAPPFPDLLIASGRRAVPYVRAVKKASGGRTFTVFLKDPRTGCGAADFIWVPEHDRLRGPNVLATLTSPHRLSAQRLAEAAASLPPAIASLPHPRVALLLGGDSRNHVFTPADIERFALGLAELSKQARLMATPSRRSPPALVAALRPIVEASGGWWWDGAGENPYMALLAGADALVVTADSVNMVGEACATGRPVYVFEPSERGKSGNRKVRAFLDALLQRGAVRFFQGQLESNAYPALNSTPLIASAIAEAFARHRSSSGSDI